MFMKHFVKIFILFYFFAGGPLTSVCCIKHDYETPTMEDPIVSIKEGKLKGTTRRNFDGDSFYTFFGIPYAKPPINDLRFKAPQSMEPWEGIRDATKVGSPSISRDDLTTQIVGSEDCLYLNVYTKNLPNAHTKLRPVMVYIHGGGFTIGSSRPGLYGPEFLMLEDIVLVTFNYRLGILGFLSLEDPSLGVPGNAGLKDQNLALKWVQKNIHKFNGDPNNVTIFGESAGGGSVHGHILSPASKGLFHKAILQSGCILCAGMWGSKNNAIQVVEKLGTNVRTNKEALTILKKVPAIDIFAAQEKFVDIVYPAFKRPFSVVIETPNDSAFLSKSPVEIMTDSSYNNVPMMIGYNNKEGMLLELGKMIAAELGVTTPEFDIENAIPYNLNIPKNSTDRKNYCEKLGRFYFKGSNFSKQDLYDITTDSYFLVGIIESLKYHLRTTRDPIYLYRMSISSQLNFLKRIMNKLGEPGSCHGDDIGYLFYMDITPKIAPGSIEDISLRTFVRLWTNFAKYGNPTPNDKLNVVWNRVENERTLKVLDIGENLKMLDIPEKERLSLWWDILKKYPFVKFD